MPRRLVLRASTGYGTLAIPGREDTPLPLPTLGTHLEDGFHLGRRAAYQRLSQLLRLCLSRVRPGGRLCSRMGDGTGVSTPYATLEAVLRFTHSPPPSGMAATPSP